MKVVSFGSKHNHYFEKERISNSNEIQTARAKGALTQGY
jgi:hypothetical protein